MLGWSRGQVGKYWMLRGICSDAWRIVSDAVVPTSAEKGTSESEDVGTQNVPTGTPFSERLLRPLSALYGQQQYQFVKDLAIGRWLGDSAYKKFARRMILLILGGIAANPDLDRPQGVCGGGGEAEALARGSSHRH